MKKFFIRLALIALAALPLRAADAIKAESLLSADDLKSIYGESFEITPQPNAPDPLQAGGAVSQALFASTGADARKHRGSLLVRVCDSPAAARTAADAAKKFAGAVKTEPISGLGDYAFSFGRQVNVVKGNVALIIAANGKTDPRNAEQSLATAQELAKKLLEKLK